MHVGRRASSLTYAVRANTLLNMQTLILNPQALSQWLMDQPPLGHKDPRPNMARLDFCPACRDILPNPVPLTSRHILNVVHIPNRISGMYLKTAWLWKAPESTRASASS